MSVKMSDYNDRSWAMDKHGWLSMRRWEEIGNTVNYREGSFHHWIGVFGISQNTGSKKWKAETRINITVLGRTYYRSWSTVWGNNTLSRVCREFAREIRKELNV